MSLASTPITIIQGASWEDAKFWYPEDLSLGVAKGQIRSAPLDRGGELYAEFTFATLTFGAVTIA